MELTDFGWRDGLLLAIVLAAVYLLVALLGLARLRGRVPQPSLPAEWQAREGGSAAGNEPPSSPEPSSAPATFAAHLDLTETREEVARLRAEVSALREELERIKAMGRVSPLYADAAALARRGFDARGVAAECGISVAEAELVMAMSRGDKDFEGELDEGKQGEIDGTGAARR